MTRAHGHSTDVYRYSRDHLNNGTYVYGGGHGVKLLSHKGHWDCSGAVSRVLRHVGAFDGEYAITSGEFASWGRAGKGQRMTVWYNDDHVFIEFHKGLLPNMHFYRFDYPGKDKHCGMYREMRDTTGFKARHWKGW